MTTAQYDEIVQALTDYNVKLTDANGELRGTYEIFADLSKAWGNMTSLEKSALAKTLAGNRQQNVFFSLMDQFGEAEKAMKSIEISGGALSEAYGEYMNSITAHVNQFKAAFTSLSDTIVNSNFVKFFIDSGTAIITVLDKMFNALGSINSMLLTIGAAKGIKSIFSAIKELRKAKEVLSITNILTTAFPTLSEAINGLSIMMRDGATASAILEAGLQGLADVVMAHPIISSIAAAAIAITTIIKVVDACTESFAEAQEKAAQSRNEYEKTVSELESLNSQLDSNKEKIKDLEAQGPLTVVTQAELDKLEKENQLLQAQIKLRQQLKDREEARSAGDASNVLTKGRVYTGDAYDNSAFHWFDPNSKQNRNYTYDIIDETTELQKQLNKAQAEYNSLLLEQMNLDPDSNLYKNIEGRKEELESLMDSMGRNVTDNLAIISDNYGSLFNSNGTIISGYEDLVERIDTLTAFVSSDMAELFSGVVEKYADTTKGLKELGEQGQVTAEDLKSDEYKDFIQNLIDVGLIADDTDESLELVASAFNSMGEAASGATNNIREFTVTIAEESSSMGNLLSAMKESVSATGLGAEAIANLKERYQELSEYNPETLFENTANGIHLNTKALQELEAAYQKQTKGDIQFQLAMLTREYNSLTKQIDRASTAAERADLYAQRDEILTQIDDTSMLAAQYEGLTSAFYQWEQAQSVGEEGDAYDSLASGLKNIKQLYKDGLVGTNKFRTAVQLMSNEDLSGASIDELIAAYDKGYPKMEKFFTDGQTGCENFLKEVQKLNEEWAHQNEDGSWDLNFDDQELADRLGISVDAIQAILKKMHDFGMDVHLDDAMFTEFERLSTLAESANQKLIELGKTDIKFDFGTDDIDEVNDQIEKAKKLLDEFKDDDGKVNLDLEGAEEAQVILASLIHQKQTLDKSAVLSVDTSEASTDVEKVIKKLQEFKGAYNELEVKTEIGADTTEAKKKCDDLLQEIKDSDPQIKADLGIDPTSIDSLNSSLNDMTAEVMVTAGLDASLVEDYQASEHDAKGTVIWDNNIRAVTKWINQPHVVHGKLYWDNVWSKPSTGSHGVNGTANVTGTALIGGDWGYKTGGRTLVGELGQEIVVDPRTGKWYTVGDNGAEFVEIPKGAIVFNHKQTQALLANGRAVGRATALLSGTALSSASGFLGTKRPIGGYSNSGNKTTKNTVSQNTAKKSTSNKTSDEESEFERLYKYHQHLLEMDAESVEDYLNWLNDAYKKAYKNNEIELDDYYKFEEETYKGLQDLFKDYLDDIEHEISMRENFKGEAKAIIKLYQQMIDAVQAEIKAARANGLKDTDDYIQDLQDKYWDYYDAIKDLREDTTEAAKDAVDDLVDYRIDMLKKEADKEKDKIQERLSYLREFYQKQKDLLRDIYDEDKYYEDQAEKRKAVSDIEAEIAKIQYDNSAWAQKRRLELAEDLAKAQKDLDDFEKDHALEVAQEQLDKQLEMQEKALEDETDVIDKSLESAKDIYERALADIRNGSVELYQEMIEYNALVGSGIDSDIRKKWEDAYVALKDYYDLFDEHYKGVNLANATGYRNLTEPSTSWDTHPISGYEPKGTAVTFGESTVATQAGGSGAIDDAVKRKVAAAIWRGGYGWGSGSERVRKLTEVFGSNNGIQALVNKGVGKGEAAPGNEYTYLNMRKRFRGYASGTRNALAGIHAIDEKGIETIFESSDGTRYKMFTGGEKVLNAKASNFLYDFANSGGELLSKIIAGAASGIFSNIHPITNNINVNEGDIIIQGNAGRETVSEIRRIKRDSMDALLKEINRLNKF